MSIFTFSSNCGGTKQKIEAGVKMMEPLIQKMKGNIKPNIPIVNKGYWVAENGNPGRIPKGFEFNGNGRGNRIEMNELARTGEMGTVNQFRTNFAYNRIHLNQNKEISEEAYEGSHLRTENQIKALENNANFEQPPSPINAKYGKGNVKEMVVEELSEADSALMKKFYEKRAEYMEKKNNGNNGLKENPKQTQEVEIEPKVAVKINLQGHHKAKVPENTIEKNLKEDNGIGVQLKRQNGFRDQSKENKKLKIVENESNVLKEIGGEEKGIRVNQQQEVGLKTLEMQEKNIRTINEEEVRLTNMGKEKTGVRVNQQEEIRLANLNKQETGLAEIKKEKTDLQLNQNEETRLANLNKQETGLTEIKKGNTELRGNEQQETRLAKLHKQETGITEIKKGNTELRVNEQQETGFANLSKEETRLTKINKKSTDLLIRKQQETGVINFGKQETGLKTINKEETGLKINQSDQTKLINFKNPESQLSNINQQEISLTLIPTEENRLALIPKIQNGLSLFQNDPKMLMNLPKQETRLTVVQNKATGLAGIKTTLKGLNSKDKKNTGDFSEREIISMNDFHQNEHSAVLKKNENANYSKNDKEIFNQNEKIPSQFPNELNKMPNFYQSLKPFGLDSSIFSNSFMPKHKLEKLSDQNHILEIDSTLQGTIIPKDFPNSSVTKKPLDSSSVTHLVRHPFLFDSSLYSQTGLNSILKVNPNKNVVKKGEISMGEALDKNQKLMRRIPGKGKLLKVFDSQEQIGKPFVNKITNDVVKPIKYPPISVLTFTKMYPNINYMTLKYPFLFNHQMKNAMNKKFKVMGNQKGEIGYKEIMKNQNALIDQAKSQFNLISDIPRANMKLTGSFLKAEIPTTDTLLSNYIKINNPSLIYQFFRQKGVPLRFEQSQWASGGTNNDEDDEELDPQASIEESIFEKNKYLTASDPLIKYRFEIPQGESSTEKIVKKAIAKNNPISEKATWIILLEKLISN